MKNSDVKKPTRGLRGFLSRVLGKRKNNTASGAAEIAAIGIQDRDANTDGNLAPNTATSSKTTTSFFNDRTSAPAAASLLSSTSGRRLPAADRVQQQSSVASRLYDMQYFPVEELVSCSSATRNDVSNKTNFRSHNSRADSSQPLPAKQVSTAVGESDSSSSNINVNSKIPTQQRESTAALLLQQNTRQNNAVFNVKDNQKVKPLSINELETLHTDTSKHASKMSAKDKNRRSKKEKVRKDHSKTEYLSSLPATSNAHSNLGDATIPSSSTSEELSGEQTANVKLTANSQNQNEVRKVLAADSQNQNKTHKSSRFGGILSAKLPSASSALDNQSFLRSQSERFPSKYSEPVDVDKHSHVKLRKSPKKSDAPSNKSNIYADAAPEQTRNKDEESNSFTKAKDCKPTVAPMLTVPPEQQQNLTAAATSSFTAMPIATSAVVPRREMIMSVPYNANKNSPKKLPSIASESNLLAYGEDSDQPSRHKNETGRDDTLIDDKAPIIHYHLSIQNCDGLNIHVHGQTGKVFSTGPMTVTDGDIRRLSWIDGPNSMSRYQRIDSSSSEVFASDCSVYSHSRSIYQNSRSSDNLNSTQINLQASEVNSGARTQNGQSSTDMEGERLSQRTASRQRTIVGAKCSVASTNTRLEQPKNNVTLASGTASSSSMASYDVASTSSPTSASAAVSVIHTAAEPESVHSSNMTSPSQLLSSTTELKVLAPPSQTNTSINERNDRPVAVVSPQFQERVIPPPTHAAERINSAPPLVAPVQRVPPVNQHNSVHIGASSDSVRAVLTAIKQDLLRVPGVLVVGLRHGCILVQVSRSRRNFGGVARFMAERRVPAYMYECEILSWQDRAGAQQSNVATAEISN